ncbi:YkvA family protein [Alcanivorax profundi]|uniref:YkvA family protein n=1 Tax=Alcanivorax profundi TaxID=2338368 RepID=UPI0032B123CC
MADLSFARRRAERILRSVSATRWLARLALQRGDTLKARLGDAAGDVRLFAVMLYDWATGRYRQVPWSTLVSLAAALVYFLIPLDAIPDPIIALGLLDDAGVLARAARQCRGDIEQYRQWRSEQGEE